MIDREDEMGSMPRITRSEITAHWIKAMPENERALFLFRKKCFSGFSGGDDWRFS